MTSVETPTAANSNLGIDWVKRIRTLESNCRTNPADIDSLISLRDARLEAGRSFSNEPGDGCKTWPPASPDPFPKLKRSIPKIDAKDLTLEALIGSMYHHGALIISNMLSAQRSAELCEQIDHVMDEAASFSRWIQQPSPDSAPSSEWFNLMPNTGEYARPGAIKMMKTTDSVWTFLSPSLSNNLIELFNTLELKKLLTGYFDDEPCLSFLKSVLRRVKPLDNLSDWHQDGSFMTTDIKSINLWVALTDCGEGTNRPGIDLVPKRFNSILESGTNGAYFDWSVSPASINEWFKECPPVRPHFNAGDAIFFDHYNLHVTSYDERFTDTRYALETWFFAKSHSAVNQKPVFW